MKDEKKSTLLYDVMCDTTKYDEEHNLYHFPLMRDRTIDDERADFRKRMDPQYEKEKTSVKVIGVESIDGPFGFTGTQTIIKVLTERIPYFLDDAKGKFKAKDTQILLYNALQGY